MHEIIDREAFVNEMEHHWEQRLGNVSSHALRQTWRQIGRVFNEHIANHENPEYAKNWTVLQPKTGTGKTQGTIVYCSLLSRLPDVEHPGVLIVTRRKLDADDIRDQINDLAQCETAIVHHSDSQTKVTELIYYPVVVITHRFYEMALDQFDQRASIESIWPLIHKWEGGTRKLIIIDECIDIVEHSQGSLMGLKQTLAVVPVEVEDKFPGEVKALEQLVSLLKATDRIKNKNGRAKEALLASSSLLENPPDLSKFREAMRNRVRYDLITLKRSDPKVQARLREQHDSRIKALNTILRSWAYYSKTLDIPTLNTARLLVPEDVKGAVILDATANSNVLLDIWKNVCIETAYENVRRYDNVSLHYSRGHKTGKVHMSQNAKKVCKDLMTDLNARFCESDRALIVTHKALEPVLMTFKPGFQMMTGHWGAIDGSNEWRDCNKVVIFGLPHKPDTWSANLFMAFNGPMSTEWLQSEGDRPFGRHVDIRRSLKQGSILVDVIQAINRARCRKVIDGVGNCEPTSVWILLPDDQLSDFLLEGISKDMPGIRLREWSYTSQKQKKQAPRRGKWEEALLRYLLNMEPGVQPAAHIRNNLWMSPRTLSNLTRKARDKESDFYRKLTEAGIRYEVQRSGKTQRGLFIKKEA